MSLLKTSRKKSGLFPPFLKKISFNRPTTDQGFPFNIPAFQRDFTLEFSKPVTIFTGANATGKSTLLEFIAHRCSFNLLGGSRDHCYQTLARDSYPHLKKLADCMRLAWLPKVSQGFFLRAETFFNFLEYIHDPRWQDLEASYGGNLLTQSHGEGFLSFFRHRLPRGGLYLMDEPEAALSPMHQMEFLKILKEIENRGNAQVILVTHSPLLMGYPTAELYEFGGRGIKPSALEKTQHFQVMKSFCQAPQAFIRRLLENE